MLEADPGRIGETRPSGRRPLSAAIECGHAAVARLLVERGADPNWPEPTAPKGRALHAAATSGDRQLVELLLAHGADPNSGVDSAASPVFAAATVEIRELLLASGATIDPFDLIWSGGDDEVMHRVAQDPGAASRGGAPFPFVCSLGKRALLERMLQAGIRIPPVITGCQTYLLEHADMLRTLLAHGMSPDLRNWQHQTLLHHACTRHDLDRVAILLDAGATTTIRDDEYRSTPLAWASRTNAVDMVRFLLDRGTAAQLVDDEPWATPLAWAERRGHAVVASILRSHGATRATHDSRLL